MEEREQFKAGERIAVIPTSAGIDRCCYHWVVHVSDLGEITIHGKTKPETIKRKFTEGNIILLEATDRYDRCSNNNERYPNYRIWKIV